MLRAMRGLKLAAALDRGDVATINDISAAEGVIDAFVSRFLRLAYLSPDVLERLLISDGPARCRWTGWRGPRWCRGRSRRGWFSRVEAEHMVCAHEWSECTERGSVLALGGYRRRRPQLSYRRCGWKPDSRRLDDPGRFSRCHRSALSHESKIVKHE